MKKRLIKLSLLMLVSFSNIVAGGEDTYKTLDTYITLLDIPDLKPEDDTLYKVGSFMKELYPVLKDKAKLVFNGAAAYSKDLKSFVWQQAQSNPKTACALGVAGITVGGYGLYKKFAKTQKEDQKITRSALEGIDTSSLLYISGEPEKNYSSSNAQQIDPLLKARIDEEIKARGGDVNAFVNNWDGIDRTVLMNYIFDNNFEAIKYLINEKKASLNLVNSRGETIYNYAATMTSPEVLEYLLSFELPQNVNLKSVIEDLEFTIYHATPSDKIKYNLLLQKLQDLKK